MKIVLVVHHKLTRLAGAAGVTLELSDAYTQLGHQVVVISYDDMPKWCSGRLLSVLFPLYVALRLSKENKKGSVDVVDYSSSDGWFLNFVARKRKFVSVFRSHGLEHLHYCATLKDAKLNYLRLSSLYPIYWGGINLWQVRRAAKSADGCIFLNTTENRFATKYLKIEKSDSVVISNGLEQSFLEDADRVPRLSKVGVFRAVFAGSYNSVKGVHILSTAVNELMGKYPDFHLRLIGTGVERDSILPHFAERYEGRIQVVPVYNRSELPHLFSDCDILVLPSTMEPFGRVLIEAMACGVVPVASNVPGPRDLLKDELCGMLFRNRDSDALVKTIEELICQPARVTRMASMAQRRAKDYTVRLQAERSLAFYEKQRTVRNCLPSGQLDTAQGSKMVPASSKQLRRESR